MSKTKSNRVKQNQLLCRFFFILSLVCTWGPLLVFLGFAFRDSNTVQKVSVSVCYLASIIITVFNIIAKKKLRSPFYLILIGLYVGLGELLPCLFTLTITSILDEFCFHPLYDIYKTKYISSKEAEGVLNELQG